MPNIFFLISKVYPFWQIHSPQRIVRLTPGGFSYIVSYDFLAHAPLSVSNHIGFSVPHGYELLISGILHFQFSFPGATLFPHLYKPILSQKSTLQIPPTPLILLYFTYLLCINDLVLFFMI